ncbi:MAG TPA: hypothetical protein VFX85_03700 [Solirubrobacterales bacterium]|nr:hypothetical protein [Solirubrobacterales bacterium]
MGAVRIHWQTAGKLAAASIVVLLGLQVLPGLLRPPAPAPLEPDVGLPRMIAEPRRERALPRRPRPEPLPEPRRVPRKPAVSAPVPAPPPPPTPPPPPPPPPESPPAPSPAAAPEPSPPAGDGSEEFAPR